MAMSKNDLMQLAIRLAEHSCIDDIDHNVTDDCLMAAKVIEYMVDHDMEYECE